MGTKMTPSYANIFMGYLKKQLLMLVPLKPHMWLRFTDDIDIQWRHSRKYLHEFLNKANAFHKAIKFTSEISNDNHVFLDTKSRIETVTSICSKRVAPHATVARTSHTVLL